LGYLSKPTLENEFFWRKKCEMQRKSEGKKAIFWRISLKSHEVDDVNGRRNKKNFHDRVVVAVRKVLGRRK
jgi:hypothetical protein